MGVSQLCLVAVPRHASGQSASAEVNGTVTDETGAIFPDVQVVLAPGLLATFHLL
jgi:hypothetical protein